MARHDPSLPGAIKDACAHFDRTRARQLAEQLAAEIRAGDVPYPASLALTALKPLRRKRFFDIALDLAEAVFESGQTDPLARSFYAQALIDTGRLAAAIPYIRSLIDDTTPMSSVRLEAEGLLGRVYKQLYVNGGGDPALRRDYVKRAFDAYYGVYSANNAESWHGINAVALFHRAPELALPNARATAEAILADMKTQIDLGKGGGWAHATAGEAALALEDYKSAREHYEQHAASDADAFELASSLRQLIEVWRLRDDTPPGKELLPLLRAALLKREGGSVDFGAENVRREIATVGGLEKTFGTYGAQVLGWYKLGLERCKGVCRIEYSYGRPVGTGFVVRGGDFHPSLQDEMLVLTNHHVINDAPGGSLRAGNAQARFEALENAPTFPFDAQVVWSSAELDATIVRFAAKCPDVEPFPMADACPTRTKDQPPPLPRVYVIGHPSGGGLSISLVDNELVASDRTRLHYRAPTEPGSSGSPVFDENWLVVGLHHAGAGKMENLFGGEPYPANEAYWIGEIQRRCAGSNVTRGSSPPPPS